MPHLVNDIFREAIAKPIKLNMVAASKVNAQHGKATARSEYESEAVAASQTDAIADGSASRTSPPGGGASICSPSPDAIQAAISRCSPPFHSGCLQFLQTCFRLCMGSIGLEVDVAISQVLTNFHNSV